MTARANLPQSGKGKERKSIRLGRSADLALQCKIRIAVGFSIIFAANVGTIRTHAIFSIPKPPAEQVVASKLKVLHLILALFFRFSTDTFVNLAIAL